MTFRTCVKKKFADFIWKFVSIHRRLMVEIFLFWNNVLSKILIVFNLQILKSLHSDELLKSSDSGKICNFKLKKVFKNFWPADIFCRTSNKRRSLNFRFEKSFEGCGDEKISAYFGRGTVSGEIELRKIP